MKNLILGFVFTVLMAGFASISVAEEKPNMDLLKSIVKEDGRIRTALMSPAQIDPRKGMPSSPIIRICNDDYMACLPGDTCCSTKKACPSDGKCP